MAYASWSVVFGEQPSAAKWNILGTNDASFNDGTGIADSAILPKHLLTGTGSTWAWASWTPTLSGRFDDGDWTKTAFYIQMGKTVFWRMKLVATAAAPMGGGSTDAIFTLPVTARSGYAGADQTAGIGSGGIYDSGTAVFLAMVFLNSASNDSARIRSGTSGVTSITSTAPMTWTTNDEITVSGMYEAA